MDRLCQVCEEAIVGKRSDAKYCSKQCLQTAEKRRYNQRKFGKIAKPRGKNTGRSSLKEYRTKRNAEYTKRMREKIGYKGRYAKARELGYRSMFEVAIVAAAEKEGLSLEYEPFKLNYQIMGQYTPDAVLPNGIVLEFKGRLLDSDKRKMVAVKSCNPHLDIRFIFQNASQRIGRSKNSKTYGQWALSKGFDYAEKTIPLEWWEEEKKDA